MKKTLAFVLLLSLALPGLGFWCDCAEASQSSMDVTSVERPGCGCCESSTLENSSCDPGVLEQKSRAMVFDIAWRASMGASAAVLRSPREPDARAPVPVPLFIPHIPLFIVDGSLRL